MASNKQNIDKLLETLDKAKVAFQFEFLDRWNRRTPVRSGALRAGNEVNVTDTEFTFHNEVPYFPFIEDGTDKIAPVGMLKVTLTEKEEIWDIAMKRAKR